MSNSPSSSITNGNFSGLEEMASVMSAQIKGGFLISHSNWSFLAICDLNY